MRLGRLTERLRGLAGLAFSLFMLVWARGAFAVDCNVIGAPPTLNFGTYDIFSPAPTDANSTFTLRCNKGPAPSTITLSLDRGLNFQAPSSRRMASGGSFLNYNAFKDGAYSDIWGDNTFGFTPITVVKSTTGLETFVVTMYGRVPAGQMLPPGTYTDTLTLTYEFSGPKSPKTENVSVIADIVGSCSFITKGSIDFGYLDPLAAPAVSGVVVQPQIYCSPGLPYVISDDKGLHEAVPGSPPLRLEDTTAANYIPYTISYTAGGTGTGASQPLDITAGIAAGSYAGAPADVYTDLITLTVTW